MNDGDPYVYPGTDILQNKVGITNAARLDQVDRGLVGLRALETRPGLLLTGEAFWPSSLFCRVIHVSGDSACNDHALDQDCF